MPSSQAPRGASSPVRLERSSRAAATKSDKNGKKSAAAKKADAAKKAAEARKKAAAAKAKAAAKKAASRIADVQASADTRRIANGLTDIVGDTVDQHKALVSSTSARDWVTDSDYSFAYADRAAFDAGTRGCHQRVEVATHEVETFADAGGIIDDLIVYFLGPGRFRAAVNAATRDKDLAWMRQHSAGFDVALPERAELAMNSAQGPTARERAAQVLR